MNVYSFKMTKVNKHSGSSSRAMHSNKNDEMFHTNDCNILTEMDPHMCKFAPFCYSVPVYGDYLSTFAEMQFQK